MIDDRTRGPDITQVRAEQPFRMRSLVAPLAAVVLGTFMAILDNTVINVAFPTLGRVFQTDLHELQWVITGYMLAQAAVIPLSGWLSDRFGAKKVYLTAVTLFALGSALCALAWSGASLVGFRVLQGLGGGMLMPIGMAFNYRVAPPDRRGQVMGVFGIVTLLAPALGPLLSGYLLEFADWRLIFLINIPVGIAAFLIGLRALPRLPAPHAAGTFDAPGVLLGPLAFASITYGIAESTTEGWTGLPTLLGVGLGTVLLIAFIWRELTAEHPLLDFRVFRSRQFSLAILTQWATTAGLFGTMFLVPLFLQTVWGFGSFETGLYVLVQAIGAAAFMPIGGRIFDRFGVRATAVPGLFLVVIAQFLLSRITTGTLALDIRMVLLMQGAGMGMTLMPVGTHILNSAPRHLVTRVTSLAGALQNVVVSLAIATYATLLQSHVAGYLAELPPGQDRTPDVLVQVTSRAFGDVYVVSLSAIAVAFLLALVFLSRRSTVPRRDLAQGEPR